MLSSEDFNQFSNTDIERNVLSALMIDNSLLKTYDVNGAFFYGEANKRIVAAMQALSGKGSSLDVFSLYEYLKGKNEINNIGGLEYLQQISRTTFTTVNIESHLGILKNLALKRFTLEFLDEAREKILNGDDFYKLVDDLQKALGYIAMAEAPKQSDTNIASDFTKLIDDIKEKAKQKYAGVPTGFYDLDDMVGYLQECELIIIGARPGVGKTAFALSIARNIAHRAKGKVLFFSLEMSEKELHERNLSAISGVSGSRIHVPQRLTEADYERIERAKEYENKLIGIIKVQDNPSVTLSSMRAEARQMQMREGLDIVIVDYLQLVTAEGSHAKESATQAVTEISKGLKRLAKELKIPVIALSQLNRELKDRQDKRPQATDLRQSGSIEQDADVILLLHREAQEDNTKSCKAEVIVAKNRHGGIGTIELMFDGNTTAFKPIFR